MTGRQSNCPSNCNALVQSLPNKIGVYQFFDESGNIIYVGKAKNLRKRVASYFRPNDKRSGKQSVMVKKIADIRTIVVESELDALLLENNLIKKYQPRYNVMLKDDKTFPWICIKNEPFPRIFTTRNVAKDGSKYYGPYASVRMMNSLLELIRQLFHYRTCKLELTPENIEEKKFKVCLEYHIGNCKGPCEGYQSQEDYNNTIEQIEEIIKGNLSGVKKQLKKLMWDYSSEFEFEKAQMIKEKVDLLENYQSKSTVVNPSIDNVDVFSVLSDQENGYINFLKVVNGAIVHSHTLEVNKKLDESDNDLLEIGIAELRPKFQSNSKEIIVPFLPEFEIPDVRFTVPKKGDKKSLLELSERNVKYYQLERNKRKELVDPHRHIRRLLKKMQSDLNLPELPVHIECFDNSNTSGKDPVAAMVVFRNGKPSKKEYRLFNIKTVDKPDDYASLEEVVYRRYKRLLSEEQPLPQLIVIDGGKGQLSSGAKALEQLELLSKIRMIGIAKRLEEIYRVGDSIPLYLNKKSETLKVIQHLRDEAHRFGITHHRKRREKASLMSELSGIKGIGEKTAEILLKHFKSVKRLKEADLTELEEVAGPSKARILKEFFQKNKSKS